MNNRRLAIVTVLVVLVALLTVNLVSAGTMTFGFKPGSIVAEGWIAGWGFADKDVTLTASGTATAMCQNNGGKQAPGRNPVYVSVTATGTFHTDENGKALVSLTGHDTLASVSPSPSPKTAGCPSDSWTLVGLSWRSTNWTATSVTAYDSATGALLATNNYSCTTTFGPDTDGDGVGEAVAINCTLVP